MSAIIIKYDGTDITADVVFSRTTFTSQADGLPGTATVVIDDPEHSYSFTHGKTLELFIDGVRQWDGWVLTKARTWPFSADDTTYPTTTDRLWILTGQDRNLLFQKRILVDQVDPTREFKIWPVDTPDRTALLYALNNYVDLSGDDIDYYSGIKSVGSPGPYEEFTLGYVSAPLGTIFSDCSDITGAVFFIDPDRVLRYVSDRIVTAPFVLSDSLSGGHVRYRELDAGLDYTNAANEAIVLGAGKGDSDPVGAKYTDQSSVATYGLWQWGDFFEGAYKQATVNKRARTYVEGSPEHRLGHNDPVPVVQCTIFTPGIRAGHVVDFRSTVFGYQEDLPVRQVNISFDTPTLARFRLELTTRIDIPFGAPDLYPFKVPRKNRRPIQSLTPPIGGGPISGFDGTLIDHFDQAGSAYLVADTTAYVFSFSEGQSFYTITYPCELLPGDFIVLAYTANSGATPMGGLTLGGEGDRGGPVGYYFLLWGASGSAYHQWATAWHRVVDGTEGVYTQLQFVGDASPFVNIWLGVFRNVAYVVEAPSTIGTGTESGSYSGNPFVYAPSVGVSDAAIWTLSPGVGNGLVVKQWETGEEFPISSVLTLDICWATPLYALEQVSFSSTPSWPIRANEVDGTTALGVALRYDFDGSEIMPAWGLTPAPPSSSGLQAMVHLVGGGQAELLVTPGQDVTGAPWSGGNFYHFPLPYYHAYYDPPRWFYPGLYEVGNSKLMPRGNTVNYLDHNVGFTLGQEIITKSSLGVIGQPYVRPTAMTYPPYEADFEPWAPWTSGLSKYKFLFNLGDYQSSTAYAWQFDVQVLTVEIVDGVPWLGRMEFWLSEYNGVQGWLTRNWGQASSDKTSRCEGTYDFVLQRNTDYYLLVDAGTEGVLRHKLWAASQTEPEMWEEDTPRDHSNDLLNNVYTPFDGGPPFTPDDQQYPSEESHGRMLSIQFFAKGADTAGIDAIWAPRAQQTVSWTSIRSETPRLISTDGTAPLYATASPYVPGTLVVYREGIRLRPGIDYIEVSPTAGTFRVIGSDTDYANSLSVEYTAAGDPFSTTPNTGVSTEGTGGSVVGGIFSDPSANFDSSVIGSTIVINGVGYIVVAVTDAQTLVIEEVGNSGTAPPDTPPGPWYIAIADVVYRPAPVILHGWGTEMDPWNALMACSATALDRATSGAFSVFNGTPRSTPANHRQYANPATMAGTLQDLATGWQAGWSKTLLVQPGNWSQFVSMIDLGRGAIILGTYANLPPNKRFGSFSTPHALFINDRLPSGAFWGVDPLTSYPVIYTEEQLRAYAEGFVYPGRIEAAFTQVTT